MNTKTRLTVFHKLCLLGAILAFCVIVLGAYVRLSHAGLGCPDWPGCYGHLTAGQAAENHPAANAAFPERPVEYAKALKEMLHRYLATTLGVVILVIGALAWRNRQDPLQPVGLPLAAIGLVIFQGLLGMWTVTLLLKPAIVSAHLAGGLTTMALLWWMSLQTTRRAFVLWRGLGIDYEGGVLDHPARVAIHYTHRIGAIVAALVLGFVAWKAVRTGQSPGVRTAGIALALALATQWLVAPIMVIKTFPLPLATAHNAIAALLVLAMVALLRFLFPPKGSGLY